MNQSIQLTFDKPAFYRWVVEQEGRFELENGRVIDMTGATKAHSLIVSNFIGELRQRLDLDVWRITPCDVAVEIGDIVRYPDVVVEKLQASGGPLVAEEAVLLVEVLSPSSVNRDLRKKAAEYATLALVHTYIVASQDDPRVWVWQRAAGAAFPAEPVEIAGRDKTLPVHAFAFELALATLYRGVGV